jgi:hypothetical protein
VAGHRDHPEIPLGAIVWHLADRQGIQSIRNRFREIQANACTTIAQIFNAYSAKYLEGEFSEAHFQSPKSLKKFCAQLKVSGDSSRIHCRLLKSGGTDVESPACAETMLGAGV